MKILLASDFHGQSKIFIYLAKILKQDAKAIIISGDLTAFGDQLFLKKVFDLVKKSGKDAFVITGNADTENIRRIVNASPYGIHLKKRRLEKWGIIGINEIDNLPVFDSRELRDSILVTHKPPLISTLKKPLQNSPKFHICGHLHNISGLREYPSTSVIHVPSLLNGRFGVFDPDLGEVVYRSV